MDVFPVTFEHVWVAETVEGILLNAHWNIRGVNQLPAPARVPTLNTSATAPLVVQGVYVQATSDEQSQAAGRALYDALESTVASGVFSPVPLPNPEDPRVWVYVGDKPTPLRSWVK